MNNAHSLCMSLASGLNLAFLFLSRTQRERCSILAFDQNTDLYGVWAAGPALAHQWGTCGPYEHAWAMFSMLCGAGWGWHRSSRVRGISILSTHSGLAALTGEACS